MCLIQRLAPLLLVFAIALHPSCSTSVHPMRVQTVIVDSNCDDAISQLFMPLNIHMNASEYLLNR